MDGAKNNGTSSGETAVHFKGGSAEVVRVGSMSSSPGHVPKSGCFNLPILFERAGSCCPTPRFDSDILESEQWKSYFPQTHRRFQYALIYILVACVFWAIYFGGFNQYAHQWPYFLIGTIILFIIIALVLGFTYTRHYKKLYLVTSVFVSIVICVAVLLTLIHTESDLSTIGAFTASVEILLLIYSVIPLPLIITVIIGVAYSVLFEVFNLMQNQHMQEPVFIAGKILLHLCIHIMGVHIFTMRQVRQRSTFLKIGQSVIVRQDLEFEKQIKEKMIHSLMPPSVAAQVMKAKAGKDEGDGNQVQLKKRNSKTDTNTKSLGKGEIIFRTFNMNVMEDVSILFADIVGFTKMSSNKTAERLVGLLNDLFGRFDDLCTETGCEKISTLGDCYYCVAGCPIPKSDHAKCCVEMGLGMIEAIKQFDIDNNEEVNMRVGVHTGTVLCGIVGTRRFKFDVWSNDVILANNMESSGEPGRVHISETSLMFLKDEYEVEPGEDCEGASKGVSVYERLKDVLQTTKLIDVLQCYKENIEEKEETADDNRSERKLVEEYDKDTSQYAVKHATWDKMIKTYFIVSRKNKDGAKTEASSGTAASDVQPDTVAISIEAENGPTESESLMNDAAREQQDANGIMTTLSSHLNNSLSNLDEKDVDKSSSSCVHIQSDTNLPPPTESKGNGVCNSSTANLLDNDMLVSSNQTNIPYTLSDQLAQNKNIAPDNSLSENKHSSKISTANENICSTPNMLDKDILVSSTKRKESLPVSNTQSENTDVAPNELPENLSTMKTSLEDTLTKSKNVTKTSTVNANITDEAVEISDGPNMINHESTEKTDRDKDCHIDIEVHIPNPNGEVMMASPKAKAIVQPSDKNIKVESKSGQPDRPIGAELPFFGIRNGSPFSKRSVRSIKSNNSPHNSQASSRIGSPVLSRDNSQGSSNYNSPRQPHKAIMGSTESCDKLSGYHHQQFENFFNPSPKTSPAQGGKKRIYVPLSGSNSPVISNPQSVAHSPQLLKNKQEERQYSILSAVSTIGLNLLRMGDITALQGEMYDLSLEPMNKTFSKIRNINHHTDSTKAMDLHIVKCIQEGIKDKEYLYKPPINQLTLAFTDKNLEENYRDHYLGEEHNQRTMSAPKYLSFLEIIVSFVVFIVVSIFCFVVFDVQLPWLIFFCIALVLEVLNIVRGYMTIKHSENKEPGFWNRMISVTSGWYLRNILGAVIASLPLIAVFVNFSCNLMRSSDWVDRYFCFCIVVSMVHYTNFTTLSSWMKSIIVFLAGVVLIILITLIKCTDYTDLDLSTLSPVTATQIVFANTSFPNVTDSGMDTSTDSNATNSKEYIPLFSGIHVFQSYAFFEIILDMLLLVFLIGFLNRESEISYRLNYHGDAQAWEYKQIMQENKDQADWLLHNIIPPHVSEVVRETSQYSKKHTDVGVIFAAIVNFNEIYDESYEGGREFLRVLNELVSDYEDLLDEQRFKDVEKIKTISSTFMAASGLNEISRARNANPKSHLYALMEFSTELQNCINRFNDSLFNFDFIMKIGFNFGEVVAGVIGTTKLLYDIWGDTVNISSRMYSTGVAERIQVPEACAEALSEKMEFEYRGEISVKGKGEMKTFLYTKTKDGESWPWE